MRGKGSTIVTISIATLLVFTFLSPICHSASEEEEINGFPLGWSDDILLSPFRGTFPAIAMAGSNVHILYDNGSNGEIYYARSTDNGESWDKNEIFTPDDIYPSGAPKLAISEKQVNVVWQDIRLQPPKKEIFYQRSINNGDTFEPEYDISLNDGQYSQNPSIACSGSNIHVVWADERTGDFEVFYKMSNDSGLTWHDGLGNIGQDRRLTFYAGWSDGSEDIVAIGDDIHLLFCRVTPGNIRRTMYLHSPDNGATWDPEIEISNDPLSAYPDGIASEGSNVHIIWSGFKDGNREIYYRNSTDNGNTWNPEIRLTFDPDGSEQNDIAVNNSHVFVTWMDDRDHYDWTGAISGAFELYFIESFDGGSTWESETRLTYAVNNSIQPCVAMDADYIHIAWTDNRTNGNREQIFYKRYPDFPADPEYNITLNEGWNLVSLPLEQSDESIDQVLSSIAGKWDCVQTYDPLSSEPWKTNNTFRPDQLNDLDTLNDKMGFWINVTEPNVTLTVSGPIPTSTSINLYAGWNLIGYPSMVTDTVANALWGTGADKVEVFDPAEPYRIKEAGPTYVMKPGEGYWVHVPADTTWTIDW